MVLQPTFNNFKAFSVYFVLALGIFSGANASAAPISQTPLITGGGNVPGSLALVPSVEYPTILTYANVGNYSASTVYAGYFNSNKCYTYTYVATESATNASRFTPVSEDSTRTCAGNNVWSGNHLNWAATQTIDPFRSALTGGYRIVDTPSLTIVQKARNTGQSGGANRVITKTFTGNLSTTNQLYIRISGLQGKMEFTTGPGVNLCTAYVASGVNKDRCSAVTNYPFGVCQTPNTGTGALGTTTATTGSCKTLSGNEKPLVTYNGSNFDSTANRYEAYVRAEVCKTGVGEMESNCKQYGSNWKPEGLLQQYSADLRYSVFGYLNDSTATRDGGVLRASQKYIGPKLYDQTANPRQEWDPATGVFVQNPDSITSSMGTTIANSGVMNYLNKFGELTNNNDKSFDPVSELYYTAIRYFKGLAPVPSYSNYASNTAVATRTQWADGFPVITDWTGMDPITYSCQKNVILGIGDTNSHKDKNLPSAETTSSANEPAKPAEVVADKSVDVVAATRRVQVIENNDTPGINLRVLDAQFTGNDNSAYIAGLAYDSHTVDMRDDKFGKQTLSTYWVDVRENADLKGKATNQYWLAAKYGGFDVPTDYGEPYTRTATLNQNWWTSGDTLENGNLRPKNFFVASDATRMVTSLKQAFAAIAAAAAGTATSLSSNSTQLDTGSAIFQSRFDTNFWSGDLLMKTVDADTGVVASTESWSAARLLNALSSVTNRKIFTANTLTPSSDSSYSVSTTGTDFKWANLDSATRALLKVTSAGSTVDDSVATNRVNYLRGDRTLERTTTDQTQPFRQRGGRLGDIINSDPVYVGIQDYGYSLLRNAQWGSAGSAYLTFRSNTSYQQRTPVVVVGANDGMLHGFDAKPTGGAELFAYVPRSVASDLYKLTDPTYAHRYYVDGPPATSDVWINGAWKTIVVGTTGAGGNGVFALDVTNPTTMTNANVLWEFNAPDMGATIFKASIVALPNGKFGVLVSSGYSANATTTGAVWLLDAANGSIIKKFTVPTTGYLGEPLAIDLNNDRMAERIYVGDTQGKLWRIDLNGTSASSWGVPSSLMSGSTALPLFTARDSAGNVQPITAPLSAALNKDGSPIILFGTGTFYQTTDNDLTLSQHTDSFYGIIDKGTAINSNRSTLLEQKIINQKTSSTGIQGRVLSNTTITASSTGWFLDLLWKQAQGGSNTLTGERVVSRAAIRNGVVVFATLTPSKDPCAGGATSWVMSLDLFGGGRLSYNYFDMSGDGTLNEGDYYTAPDGTKIPYSGRSKDGDGVVKTPTFFNGKGSDGTGDPDKDKPKDLICVAGSAGKDPTCEEVPPGTRLSDRVSWRELR